MTGAERHAALEAIAREVADCTRCRLHAGRTRSVPGEGSADTEVVFVGEGPGEQEDRQGRPFVGASGQLLTELIQSLGWQRGDVFITNVVKCRPPGNRDPEPDEIAACSGFLRRQLEALDPAVVVTVGKHSLSTFRPGERIGRVHGTTVAADPATGAANALVFSMYHPAFALYQGSNRATLFQDMAGLPGALLASRGRREAALANLRASTVEPASAATLVADEPPEPAALPAAEPGPAAPGLESEPLRDDLVAGAPNLAASDDDDLAPSSDMDLAASSEIEPDRELAPDPELARIDPAAGRLQPPVPGELPDPAGQLTLF